MDKFGTRVHNSEASNTTSSTIKVTDQPTPDHAFPLPSLSMWMAALQANSVPGDCQSALWL